MYNYIFFFSESQVFICRYKLYPSKAMNNWYANKQDEYVKITNIFLNCWHALKHKYFNIQFS